MSYLAWLTADRDRFRERSGPPTIEDVRGAGVKSREIREYLRDRGWCCATVDTGDCKGERGLPPDWVHDPTGASVDFLYDDNTIQQLAKLESRSAWQVLDDVAGYARAPRDVYHEDKIVARIKGRDVEIVNPSPGYGAGAFDVGGSW